MTRRDDTIQNRLRSHAVRAVISGVVTLSMVSTVIVFPTAILAGCEKKKPPAPPPPPPPPPPPVPDPVAIDPILQSMKPDARVQFPQNRATVDESAAKAIISICNAFAKGDSSVLSGLFTGGAKTDLDGLVNSGEWDEATAKIEAVRVLGISELPGDSLPSTEIAFVMCIQEPAGAYLLGFKGVNNSGAWSFQGVGTTPGKRARAADWDGLSLDELTRSRELSVASSGDSGAPAIGDDASVLRQYVLISASEKLLESMGMPNDLTMFAAANGIDAATIASAKAAGPGLLDKGVKLVPADIAQLIDGMQGFMATKAPGKVNDDELFRIIAEILREDAAKIKADYEAAKGGSGGGAPIGPG